MKQINDFNIDSVISNSLVNGLLDQYGLNWKVEKKELIYGGETTKSGYYGIRREDTKQTFMTSTGSYEVFQNSELAELVMRISGETGFEITNGGFFDGGSRVYLQIDTHNQINGIGENKDTVKGYASAVNSHDGKLSLKWGSTNLTISCGNTFMAVYKELSNRARHSSNMRTRVEASIDQITGIKSAEKSIFDNFIKLAEVPMQKKHILAIVDEITGVDVSKTRGENEDEHSSYALNRTEELMASISRETKQKGQTLWGLFSGVTHYTTHVAPAPKRQNGRLESKYFGSSQTTDNTAYHMMLEFAGLKK